MSRLLILLCWCVLIANPVSAQDLNLTQSDLKDEATLGKAIPGLAKQAIAIYQESDRDRYLSMLFRLQEVTGQYADAMETLRSLSELRRAADPSSALPLLPFEILTRARTKQTTGGPSLDELFKREFRETFAHLDDKTSSEALPWFGGDLNRARNDLRAAIERQKARNIDKITLSDTLQLIRQYHFYQDFQEWNSSMEVLIAEDDGRRYIIDKDRLVKTP